MEEKSSQNYSHWQIWWVVFSSFIAGVMCTLLGLKLILG
jgi:hypothetical protein